MVTAVRFLFAFALLFSFLLGTGAKAGYVICFEPDGSVKIKTDHESHCETSNHHKKTPELQESPAGLSHDTCENHGQHESHEEESSKFIEECLVHCLDVPIPVQNTVTISSPKVEALTGHSVQKEICLVQIPKQIFIGMGNPNCLKALKLEKSQRLNIIKTVVLTV